MRKKMQGFKSNLKARKSSLHKQIDYEFIYWFTDRKLQETSGVYTALSQEGKDLFINNILILAATDAAIAASKDEIALTGNILKTFLGELPVLLQLVTEGAEYNEADWKSKVVDDAT